jgi:hypothetical protein
LTPELEELFNKLKTARRQAVASCVRPQDLARSLFTYQNVVEQVFEQVLIEITNVEGGATTPVYIVRATVNQLGNVPASQETFPFDGATDLFTFTGNPSGVTSGEAINPGRAFQDNEPIKLVSFNGTTWLADKIGDNVIHARVDKAGDVVASDVTFPFDSAVSLGTNPVPAGGAGIVINRLAGASGPLGGAFADNELVVLQLIENPDILVAAGLDPTSQAWAVVQDDDDVGGGGTGGGANEAGFFIDEDELEDGIVELDRRPPTQYEGQTGSEVKIQLAGHYNGAPRWFTGIQCNPLPPE